MNIIFEWEDNLKGYVDYLIFLETGIAINHLFPLHSILNYILL
jgi:hypothetical protein